MDRRRRQKSVPGPSLSPTLNLSALPANGPAVLLKPLYLAACAAIALSPIGAHALSSADAKQDVRKERDAAGQEGPGEKHDPDTAAAANRAVCATKCKVSFSGPENFLDAVDDPPA